MWHAKELLLKEEIEEVGKTNCLSPFASVFLGLSGFGITPSSQIDRFGASDAPPDTGSRRAVLRCWFGNGVVTLASTSFSTTVARNGRMCRGGHESVIGQLNGLGGLRSRRPGASEGLADAAIFLGPLRGLRRKRGGLPLIRSKEHYEREFEHPIPAAVGC